MKGKGARIAVIVLVLVAAAAGLWWGLESASDESGEILTSGFIEAKDIAVAPEAGGRLTAITVDEGDTVTAGMTLFRLDDSLLRAQQQQARAIVALSEARLEQAIAARDGAKAAWENALDVRKNPLELEGKILAARGEADMAELELLRVREIETGFHLAAAETRLEYARKILDNLRNFEAQGLVSSYAINKEIYPAERELRLAEQGLDYQRELAENWSIPAAELRLENAKKALQNLEGIRENPQEINAAVDQTDTAYRSAEIGVTVAEKQLEQAEAALEVLMVQLGKLEVKTAISGVVAGKYAEVGEIAAPGAPVLTITDLSAVTVTAYVPESRIGLVKLGEAVNVSVDSYPGEGFRGEVVFISPNAVFTPNNVQLKEEREKMVFAVKIRLDNPDQKLKPGMPADAEIITRK